MRDISLQKRYNSFEIFLNSLLVLLLLTKEYYMSYYCRNKENGISLSGRNIRFQTKSNKWFAENFSE